MPAPLPGRDPRVLAFFLVAGGLGLAGWYGLALYQLPERTPAQLDALAEVRLAAELEHMGPLLTPKGERLEQLARMIRAEVQADARLERQEPERWMGVGLVMCVLGAGSFVLAMARRP